MLNQVLLRPQESPNPIYKVKVLSQPQESSNPIYEVIESPAILLLHIF